jgi:energy-coupling factor transport system permease protein
VWRSAEWLVSASGVVVVGSMVTAGILGVPGLQFSVYPLAAPTLPLLAAVGILVGLVPAWAAPVERPSGRVVAPTTPRVAATTAAAADRDAVTTLLVSARTEGTVA